MGYKVLITLDLQSATEKQRELFYSFLKKEKWNKITSLTTTWKVSFNEEATRISAIRTIKKDLLNAKIFSSVSGVEYAFQLDTKDIILEKI